MLDQLGNDKTRKGSPVDAWPLSSSFQSHVLENRPHGVRDVTAGIRRRFASSLATVSSSLSSFLSRACMPVHSRETYKRTNSRTRVYTVNALVCTHAYEKRGHGQARGRCTPPAPRTRVYYPISMRVHVRIERETDAPMTRREKERRVERERKGSERNRERNRESKIMSGVERAHGRLDRSLPVATTLDASTPGVVGW